MIFESIPDWIEVLASSALGAFILGWFVDRIAAKHLTDKKIRQFVEPIAKVTGLALSRFFVRLNENLVKCVAKVESVTEDTREILTRIETKEVSHG